MRIDVRIDESGLEKAYKALQRIPGAFPKAVSSAMNRTLESMRTESARETAGRYFAKSSEVRKTLQLRTANAGNLYGAMISRGGRKKLQEYKLTPKNPQVGNKKGFKGAVMRKGGLKPLPKGTFMMNTPNAGNVLFRRIRPGKAWSNIEHVVSPSIPQIVKNKETVAVVEKRAREVFEKRLNHEVMRIIGAMV